MQFTVSQAFNATAEIAAAVDFPYIRLFTASLISSNTPLNQLAGVEQNWTAASPASVGGGDWTVFSAVWFAEARKMILTPKAHVSIAGFTGVIFLRPSTILLD